MQTRGFNSHVVIYQHAEHINTEVHMAAMLLHVRIQNS